MEIPGFPEIREIHDMRGWGGLVSGMNREIYEISEIAKLLQRLCKDSSRDAAHSGKPDANR